VLAVEPGNEQALHNLAVHEKRRPPLAFCPGSNSLGEMP
jgi:hypothetical protein